MMGRLRERIRTALRAFEEGGLKWVVLTIWRYLLFWSPMAPLLEQRISETHREKLSNFRNIGYWPQIRDPRSFNEKVIHRKLFTDDDRYTTVEDKWAVREYIRDRAEMEVLPDIYHVTDDPNTIPFEALPDEFVVKGTHGSDMNCFIEDTSDLDVKEIKSQCNEWLDQTYGECTNEYWYTEIQPRILVEEYLHDDEYDTPVDFKFLVFHGSVKYVEAHVTRSGDTTNRIFDRNWNALDVRYDYPLGPAIDKPKQFDKMVGLAETLGADFDFIRVDLYQVNGERVVFGELTVAPAAGSGNLEPTEFDFELGSYW
jgi:hypothetical protein